MPAEFGLATATFVVVAGMVGAGVLTTSGYTVFFVGSNQWMLLLWILGGITAVCGALTLAELSAALPKTGGDYVYLYEAYGPLPAFLSGWVSFLIGFAGPKVIAQTVRVQLPSGFQTSEFLLDHGFLDRIVHRRDLRSVIAQLIDYTTTDFAETVTDVDVVLDTVGGDYGPRSLDTLAPGAMLIDVTGSTGSQAHRDIVRQQVQARGLRFVEFSFSPSGTDLEDITELVEQGRLRVVVDQVLPLEDASKAHELSESNRAKGKIDFFGEDAFTRVGGAGGPAWTERLPVHFDWLAAAA